MEKQIKPKSAGLHTHLLIVLSLSLQSSVSKPLCAQEFYLVTFKRYRSLAPTPLLEMWIPYLELGLEICILTTFLGDSILVIQKAF